MEDKSFPVDKTKEEWEEALSPSECHVLREHGTERAGTSPLNSRSEPERSPALAAAIRSLHRRPNSKAGPMAKFLGAARSRGGDERRPNFS
jgi:hypothetical protein